MKRGRGSSAIPGRSPHVSLRTARGRPVGSQRWLTRQLNDPYVRAAREAGWRSRAAFKLLQLDDRFRLISRGVKVLDLGAAPGGWTQVALQRGAAKVVGIDLLPVDPVPGAVFLEADVADPAALPRLADLLDGKADLVLSDMAPNTTGHAPTDHLRIMALAELAAEIGYNLLAAGGALVIKVFQGGSERHLLDRLKRRFRTVRHAKPPASRPESSELYVVAAGFRG
jgi:23S rRNA (uridine2552-2'-O)-methyltransferase